jgi:hypothetical protein
LLSKYEKKLFKDVKESKNIKETDENLDKQAIFEYD